MIQTSPYTKAVQSPQYVDSGRHQQDVGIATLQMKSLSSKNRALTFPQKLMQVLSNEEYSEIIAWLPHGKSFSILKTKAFAKDILPKHFKQAKYASFTRKLRRWGFQSILRGNETGAFYHTLFLRDNKALCEKMKCSSSNAQEGLLPRIERMSHSYQNSRPLIFSQTINARAKASQLSSDLANFAAVTAPGALSKPAVVQQLSPLELSILSHYCPSSFEPTADLTHYLKSSISLRQALLEKLDRNTLLESNMLNTIQSYNGQDALNRAYLQLPNGANLQFVMPTADKGVRDLSSICTNIL